MGDTVSIFLAPSIGRNSVKRVIYTKYIHLYKAHSIFREFPSRYLKCSFHKCICSSWLAAFSFALEVLFLLLTSFTVCHAIRDCLSSTKCRTILIWSWMNSVCSFRQTFLSSLCAFLTFWAVALVEFLLLHKDTRFYLVTFFLDYRRNFI